jgi:hypothetical protein
MMLVHRAACAFIVKAASCPTTPSETSTAHVPAAKTHLLPLLRLLSPPTCRRLDSRWTAREFSTAKNNFSKHAAASKVDYTILCDHCNLGGLSLDFCYIFYNTRAACALGFKTLRLAAGERALNILGNACALSYFKHNSSQLFFVTDEGLLQKLFG